MITGIEIDQLNKDDRQYYVSIKKHMQDAEAILNCTFEIDILDINQCNLIMKVDKDATQWGKITVDGVPYILHALLLQHQGEPLDLDQMETLRDAQKIG